MKKILVDIRDSCYSKETGFKKRIIFSTVLIIIGIGVIIWFLIQLLVVENYFNSNNPVNLTGIGQIGDFIGGLSGTLFTLVGVVLLFETLALQRTELAESRKVFEKQQFENTFFNLLNLYQEITKSMHVDDFDLYTEKTHSGKDFFKQQKLKFYSDFNPKDKFSKNRKEATKNYMKFYVETKEQTAHYFRTLYRIFRFISSSEFTEVEKMNYAKIVRAQLSESELFFIYYNAFTDYGVKFRKLINEFDILKHLPPLEKVEYKNYMNELEHFEINSINILLEDLTRAIKIALKSQTESHKSYYSGLVGIKIESSSISNFKLFVYKKEILTLDVPNFVLGGLLNFDLAKTESFFKEFLSDLIYYSNYFEYNRKEIIMEFNKSSNLANDKHTIEMSVFNINNNQIKIN